MQIYPFLLHFFLFYLLPIQLQTYRKGVKSRPCSCTNNSSTETWKKLQTQVDLTVRRQLRSAEQRRWRLLLAPVMCSLFLFKLAWLNAWQFAVCQVNLTAQWNASHSWEQNVGSFWSGTKGKREHLPSDSHCELHTDRCELLPTHMNIHVQTTSQTSPLDAKRVKKTPGCVSLLLQWITCEEVESAAHTVLLGRETASDQTPSAWNYVQQHKEESSIVCQSGS